VPNEPTRPGKHRAAHKASPRPRLIRRGRAALPRPARTTPTVSLRRHLGTAVALGGVLVAGAAVSGSALDGGRTKDAADASTQEWVADDNLERERATESLGETSRNAIRNQVSELRSGDSDSSELGTGGVASAEKVMPTDPREIAHSMLPEYGWDAGEYDCLDELWIGESNWEVDATNPTSGAYGIPQSLPPEKMASAGADWRTNPATQIAWGLRYIELSYGTPCAANEFKNAHNWY